MTYLRSSLSTAWSTSFMISINQSLLMTNSVLICLKIFVFHIQSSKMFSLGIEFLGRQLFSFNTWKIPFHSTLAPIITPEKSAVSWIMASTKAMSSSSLASTIVFFIFFLHIFSIFLRVDFFLFVLLRKSVFGLLNWIIKSGKFSSNTSSNIAPAPFSISSSRSQIKSHIKLAPDGLHILK